MFEVVPEQLFKYTRSDPDQYVDFIMQQTLLIVPVDIRLKSKHLLCL